MKSKNFKCDYCGKAFLCNENELLMNDFKVLSKVQMNKLKWIFFLIYQINKLQSPKMAKTAVSKLLDSPKWIFHEI